MEGEPQLPNAPFPAPPPFWKHFTSENLSRLKAIREDVGIDSEDTIPPELSCLEPPPAPSETYTAFGEEHTLSNDLPTLSSRGVTQLYPSADPQSGTTTDPPTHLRQIIRSLHLNFQELILILSQNPTLKDEKLEEIKNLFQNANWLVNIYRPHQARETLIEMMEQQVEKGKREVDECERLEMEVEEVLKMVREKGDGPVGGKNISGVGEVRKSVVAKEGEEDRSRRLWKMMMDINIEGG